MDKEHVKGVVDNLVGKTKETAGHAIGNKTLETEGKVQQLKGAMHAAVGDVKDAARNVVDRVKTRANSI
jgi:uncharacterized protein YjbJ (UPF0337 family)